jgi:hypothetical protein
VLLERRVVDGIADCFGAGRQGTFSGGAVFCGL